MKGKRVIEARVVTKGFSGKLTFDEFEGLSELCDVSHVDAWRKCIENWRSDVCKVPEAELLLACLLNCKENSVGGRVTEAEFRAPREEAQDQITQVQYARDGTMLREWADLT